VSAWDVELEAAVAAARAGGEAALRFFGRHGHVAWKPDDSPVGEADHAADAAIQRHLRAAFPDDAILTEESGAHPGTSGRRWIVDPIDGTRDFIRGLPYWANLIALEADAWTEGDVSPWDIAPFVVLLAEAGARFTDLRGDPAWPCRSGLAAAPALHRALLDVVRAS
jgi:fructose-1,6-bisphosphatase/inositol monophosphatase family enzyme